MNYHYAAMTNNLIESVKKTLTWNAMQRKINKYKWFSSVIAITNRFQFYDDKFEMSLSTVENIEQG